MAKKVFTLADLAHYTNSRLVGNPSHRIFNVADLESASDEDASFLSNPLYEKTLWTSQAGVIFVSPNIKLPDGRNFLISDNPSLSFQKTVEAFFGDLLHSYSGFSGIHPSAIIHETAVIGKNVSIGPHTVIDKEVKIGDNTIISAGCYVGLNAAIGKDCLLHPHVTIRERCQLGDRVILQPGVVIGGCGFGYLTDSKGKHSKLNQVGIVIIEDDVEIGANSTIDRSRFKATTIGKGTKIDNLVQIGHGVIVGEDNIIVAQTGIAGSTKTGKNVVFAGQVAVAGHIEISSGTIIAAKSGVSKSITAPGKYGGIPVVPLAEYNRNSVYLRNIKEFVDEIKKIKERLAQLES